MDDVAARTFALSLYAGLLGIKLDAFGAPAQDGKLDSLPMNDAMRQARLAIAKTPNGRTTWGAYQHYGNPYFQVFYSNQSGEGQTQTSKTRGVAPGATQARRRPRANNAKVRGQSPARKGKLKGNKKG